jgi:hypothetical protein
MLTLLDARAYLDLGAERKIPRAYLNSETNSRGARDMKSYCEGAPTGQSRHFGKQRVATEFLWRLAAKLEWVKYADQVELGMRLSCQLLDMLLAVPTS